MMGQPRALLLALLVALLMARGGSAPLQPGGGTPALTKIYPRGSHWAVGHLMGKKSSADFPDGFESENKPPFSTSPESVEDYPRWEEISKHLLRNDNKSARSVTGGSGRNAWQGDDDRRDMMDYLLRVVNMKESAPS